MTRNNYHVQAVRILGWVFGWYKDKHRNYIVPDGFQVHHIDGDYTNNSLDNLAILTVEEHYTVHKEENEARLRKGSKEAGKKGGKKTAEKLSKPVLCVETGIVYESVREAERQTGIRNSSIVRVCLGQRKTTGGYHWEYVNKG